MNVEKIAESEQKKSKVFSTPRNFSKEIFLFS